MKIRLGFVLLIIAGLSIPGLIALQEVHLARALRIWKAEALQSVTEQTDSLFITSEGDGDIEILLFTPSNVLLNENSEIRMKVGGVRESVPTENVEVIRLDESSHRVNLLGATDGFLQGVYVRLLTKGAGLSRETPVQIIGDKDLRWVIHPVGTVEYRLQFETARSSVPGGTPEILAITRPRSISMIAPPIHFIHVSDSETKARFVALSIAVVLFTAGLAGLLIHSRQT